MFLGITFFLFIILYEIVYLYINLNAYLVAEVIAYFTPTAMINTSISNNDFQSR